MNSALIKYLLFLGIWAGIFLATPTFGQNNAPVCDTLTDKAITLAGTLTLSYSASDPDGDNVTLTASGTPFSHGATFTQTTTGSNVSGIFSWNPPSGIQGTITLTFTATDDDPTNPQSCSKTITIKVRETACLLTKFAPGGFAMFLGGLPSVYSDQYEFQSATGRFEAFNDGTGRVYGTIVNTDSANWRWEVNLRLINRRDWTAWSGLGRSYKGNTPEALANHPNWDYYEVDPSSTIIGLDRFAGDTLFVVHAPANMYYGFQFGTGANDKNGEIGMSGWFSYSGAYSGAGDLNANNFCRGLVPSIAGLALLEGAYDASSTDMKTSLSLASLFPLTQPYANTDYAYQGTESISSVMAVDMVDWLLIQFRDATNPSTVVYQKAVLLHKNGRLMDADGSYLITIDSSLTDSYYISLCHRNHLDVMTAQPLSPAGNRIFTFDFTEGLTSLYHSAGADGPAAKQLQADGPWVLMGGDVTGTDAISAADLRKAGLNLNGSGFQTGDVNLNGTINQQDLNLIMENFFMKSQVPK
jgi:hypothetical protein